MSKLVRARPKSVEDMPDWAKCCPEFLAYTEKHKDIEPIVDLSTVHDASVFCTFCKRTWGSNIVGPSVRFTNGGFGCLSLLDLDEVPAELQSDKYVDSLEFAQKEKSA